MESFLYEYRALVKNKELPRDSRLFTLVPYIDHKGLMGVSGRLHKAPIPQEAKHPVILDPGNEVTRLVLTYYHQRLYCRGNGHVLNVVRQRYWDYRDYAPSRRLLTYVLSVAEDECNPITR